MTEAEKLRREKYKLAYAAMMKVYPFGVDDLDGEIWSDISGYEGFYQISNLFRLHILVARTFIPNPNNKSEDNHKFENKLDCSAENLEWVTSLENHQHASKFGLKKTRRDAKLTDEQAKYCREVYIPRNKEFGVRALARKFDVNHKTISQIIQGKAYK